MNRVNLSDIVTAVEKISHVIIKNEVYFCELDSVAGDGDFGMSVSKGFKVILDEFETIPKGDIGNFLKACGMIITEHCGGASGPIWGNAFRSAGQYSKGKQYLTIHELAQLFQSSVDGIQKIGGAKLGDKTLLDAFIPATESLKNSAEIGEDITIALKNAYQKAVEGAEKTKEYVAKKGRASYLGERSITYPDAGAMAIGVIFGSFY